MTPVFTDSRDMSLIDYVVVLVSIILPFIIGVLVSCITGCRRSYNEFLFGAGHLKKFSVAMASILPFLSSTALIDIPNSIFQRGYMTIFYPVGAVTGFLISSMATMEIVVPHRFLSLNEYLRQRFHSKDVALMGCSLVVMSTSLIVCISLDAPVKMMSLLSKGLIPVYVTVSVIVCISFLCAIFGGMRAVVWSSIAQTFLYGLTLAVFILFTQVDTRGPVAMVETNLKYGHLTIPIYSPDPRFHDTIWGMVIGVAIHWLFSGLSPQALQRMRSLHCLAETRFAFCFAGLGIFVFSCFANINGLGLLAIYSERLCSNTTAENDTVPIDNVVFHYVSERMVTPGLKGLFLGGAFCGAISATTAGISAFVAMVWEDLVQSFSFWGASRMKTTIIATSMSFFFALLFLTFGFLLTNFSDVFIAAGRAVMGATSGVYIGLLALAFFCPQINNSFVAIAAVGGLAISLWQGLGAVSAGISSIPATLPNNGSQCFPSLNQTTVLDMEELNHGLASFYAVAHVWQATIAAVVTILVGVIVGRLKSTPDRVTDKEFVLCAFCRCCRACRADPEAEDVTEDFDWMPHDTVCPIHSLTRLADRVDGTLNRRETEPLTSAPNGVMGLIADGEGSDDSSTSGLVAVTVDVERPPSPPQEVQGSECPTLQVNNTAAEAVA